MITADRNSTSAGTFPQLEPAVVGIIAVGVCTFTQAIPAVTALHVTRPQMQTHGGAIFELREPPPRIIAELRRVFGLTWEELAQLLNVSRRSVHFWASGSRITNGNRIHLERVFETLRFIDRGSASQNQAALLAAATDGTTLLDRLASADYDAVKAALGRGPQRPTSMSAGFPHSSSVDRLRLPRPPEELVDTLEDRVHAELGCARGAKTARTERGS